MIYFGRYMLLSLLFLIFGSSNLNIKKADHEQSIGGYSAMGSVFVTPIFSEEELKHYENAIDEICEKHNINGNVFIARYGTVLYNRSFGYGDFADKTLLNDTTSFQVASIGKTFTAASILLLKNRGLLNVDDPVVQHIPEFPYENITIRHLLTHTSGLQNYMWLVEIRWNKDTPPTNEDMLDLFVEYNMPVNFQPGQRFRYSNTGYAFLALLVERVSNQSFASFVETEIFQPLDMRNSFVKDLQNPHERENIAYGHRRYRRTYIKIPDNHLDGIVGDKGIYSSAVDLYKWDQALYSNSLLPREVISKAFEYGRLNNDNPVDYGLGWRLQTFLDRKVVHHPGRWHGFRTSFKRFVDYNATLVVLNNTNRNITSLIEDLQEAIFKEEIRHYADMQTQ